MRATWDTVLDHLAERVGEAVGTSVAPNELLASPKPELGDIAFGCFRVAKLRGISPAECANDLVKILSQDDSMIESVSAVGPYLNIKLKLAVLFSQLLKEAEQMGEAFGESKALEGQRILFEYANPNTHKEIHVGHLRNFILGASLVRILRRAGATVTPVSYINDVGTHVAKCLWRLVVVQGFDIKTFSVSDVEALVSKVPLSDQGARYLGQIYSDATRAVEDDPSAKEAISFVHNKLEAHDAAWELLWTETKRWSMDELRVIFEELGVRVERQYFESKCLDRAHEMVKTLEHQGIATMSQGALLIDMEDQKLGMMLLRKSDGALLYAAKDIALAELKAQEYPDFTHSLVLVDERQSLAFRQLGEALKRMGYGKPYDYLGYELVTLPEGVMSSRKGTIITFQSFRETVIDAARTTTLARHGDDWDEAKVMRTTWALALAGMKYAFLKQDPEKMIVFDVHKALAFDGDTGPYIQYAVARLSSILKKADWQTGFQIDVDATGLTSQQERRLLLRAAQFVDIVRRAARETKPSLLAQWCFGLAQDVNAFYRDVPVLDAEGDLKHARIQLVFLARHVLMHGLELLGIPVPEEM